jgi:hypothetical protein
MHLDGAVGLEEQVGTSDAAISLADRGRALDRRRYCQHAAPLSARAPLAHCRPDGLCICGEIY